MSKETQDKDKDGITEPSEAISPAALQQILESMVILY